MTRTTRNSKRPLAFSVLTGLILLYVGLSPRSTQAQNPPADNELAGYSRVIAGEITLTPEELAASPLVSRAGAGLNIIPTFDANVDGPTQTAINDALAFYGNTFSNNLTVNIYFYDMNSGLGQSTFYVFTVPYSTYRTALGNSAASTDDTTALANTPSGAGNPINSDTSIKLKSPSGLVVGINTAEQSFNFGGSPCPTFTGSGCIGLNVTLANSHSDLTAVVQHEVDEVLGLGSAISGPTAPAVPWPEDLFRWASAGVRSYAGNPSPTSPCSSTPQAFFSIDGGTTNLNEFNNCNNGGDYGDWITHTPSQVQDAFTNFSGTPSLTPTSSEVRALDVIGFTVLVTKKRRGQLISD